MDFLPPWLLPHLPKIEAALVAVLMITLARRVFRRRPELPHHTRVRCGVCSWSGMVSRHKPVCPSCGRALSG